MQGSKLYVGNLDYSVTNNDLEELFSDYGDIKEIKIINGKGIGFVEMYKTSEAEKAKKGLDGSEFKGRRINIDEARPQKTKSRRSYRNY